MKKNTPDLDAGASAMRHLSLSLSLLCFALVPACGGPSAEEALPADSATQAICNDPDGCVVDPTTGAPMPATPVLRARNDSSLTVDFKVQTGWASWAVQRRAPGGTWATAAAGNNPTTATRTFVDGGRPADSRWCYRLKATNSLGTRYSAERCGLTALTTVAAPAAGSGGRCGSSAPRPRRHQTRGNRSVRFSDTMQPGHLSLPNGLGTRPPEGSAGIAPNELTSVEDRDPYVGMPWHKHVPARLERV